MFHQQTHRFIFTTHQATIFFLFVSLANPCVYGEPALDEILQGCQYLQAGDIPEDLFEPPVQTVFVAPESLNGNDQNDGLTIDTPFEHISIAIDYVNKHPDTPYTIYLREGIYYFKDPAVHSENPYIQIERGNLYITPYQNESVTIRSFTWPGYPTEWGDETAFDINGPYENITFDGLRFEGWLVIFYLGSDVNPPLKNITIKNCSASEFRTRNNEPNWSLQFLETAYLGTNVYGEGKVIFDDPETAHYQIENLNISNITVEGVDIGINVGDENDANVKGMRISHFYVQNPTNESGNSASDAIAIVNSYKILIDHCRIVNIDDDGIDTKSYDVSVVNTYVEGTGRNAIKFWRNGEIINTIMYRCTSINDGALIIEEGPFRMINSVLYEHPIGYAATYAYDFSAPIDTTMEIVNSVIGRVKSFYINTTDYQITSNRFVYMVDDSALFSGQLTAETIEQLNAAPNCMDNGITELQFQAPEEGNFSLTEGSAWIDAGRTDGVLLPSFDMIGNPRISGTSIDIGPIESFGNDSSLNCWMVF